MDIDQTLQNVLEAFTFVTVKEYVAYGHAHVRINIAN